MKAYFAIFMFICLALKPAYTIGYVSYFELNLSEIIEKYCVNKDKPAIKCNGKCHLAKKLSYTSVIKSESNQKSIQVSLSEAFLPVYIEKTEKHIFLNLQEANKELAFGFLEDFQTVILGITPPPPQV